MHKRIISLFSLLLMFPVSAVAGTIQLPQTGQTKCYDTVGTEISCAGTGQDGDKKMGVPWSDAGRFTNNGNGTTTDNLTGLIWLQKANCNESVGGIAKSSGSLTWADALAWSNNLASGKCGLTDGSILRTWRLPTRKELKSLVNRGEVNNSSWLVSKGFDNVQADGYYWSSSSYAGITHGAWGVHMSGGFVINTFKTDSLYVWPVRGGQ
ncbi:MAG: hypothetical protein A2075_16100 [Geobacteraceae bacterium GWC2_58_44]|nr:MAG: hypothetical protein A2075_16100 [Geobacteraceae bacterium GWC2_58_44]